MNDLFLFMLFLLLMITWYFYKMATEKFMEAEPTILRLKNMLLPFFPELYRIRLMKSDASYTINKSKIYLCTESKGEKYNDNMLIFVILHELAHTMTKSIGHNKEFKNVFDSLLIRAEKVGVYNPSLPRVENYCKS